MSNIEERLDFITEKVKPAEEDKIVAFEGLVSIFVKAGVFDPSRGRSAKKIATAIRQFPPRENYKVLEIGSGTGALSILSNKVRLGPNVSHTAVDISEVAVENTKRNFAMYNVKGEAFVSDMFNNVSGRYDRIIFNCPTAHPKIANDNPANVTVWDPNLNLKSRFIEGLRRHMNMDNPDAIALMTYTIYNDYDGMKDIDLSGFKVSRILVDKDDLSEVGILVLRPE